MSSGRVERTINVHFSCQRCCQPLKLDPTFDSLDEQMFTDLTGTPYGSSRNSGSLQILNNDYQDNGDEGYEISRKLITPVRLTEGGNGFMLVGDTPSGGTEGLGHQMWVTSRWCDILSDQSEIDHPLCEECTDALLDRMDQELRIAEDECRDYREFLEKLQLEEKDEDLEQLNEEVENLKSQEAQLQEQLKAVIQEEKEVEEKLQALSSEREKLQTEEECFFAEYTSLKRQVLLCEDEQRSVDNQLRYAQAQLDKLNKTNVFNATFHIWHSGQFGTINNFKLGRLPNKPVDWSEINAAWGQTALLLYSLAKEMKLIFKRYRLVPYGNHSFLESLENKSKELPLYFSGGLKFFWDAKFDQAMVAFLDCLQQFQEEVEKGDPDFSLPYRIDNGKIEDKATKTQYSIKIQFNSEEQWTKALKFMLTNLKWGLTWVSAQFAKK